MSTLDTKSAVPSQPSMAVRLGQKPPSERLLTAQAQVSALLNVRRQLFKASLVKGTQLLIDSLRVSNCMIKFFDIFVKRM